MGKYVYMVVGIVLIGIAIGSINIHGTYVGREKNFDLRLKAMSNASYPDGNSVNNITMVYDSYNSSFLIFWNEFENYTYQGKSWNTSEIMISESTDFVNWTGAKRDIVISYEDGTNATNPAAVVDPMYGSINVIWSEMNKTSHKREIYFGQCYPGLNWTSINKNTLVTNNKDDKVSDCILPDIAVDINGEYLQGAWLGMDAITGTWEVYYGNYSLQGSGNWSSENRDVIISREDSNNATKPKILVDTHSPIRTWIFWSEFNKSSSQYEIYAANRSYSEAIWHRKVVYTGNSEIKNVTGIEVFPYIYIFWEQIYNGHFEIYTMRYNETSDVWSNEMLVSYPDGHDARNPSASGFSRDIYVVWDEYDEDTGYKEIMISNSTPAGWSGSSRDINVTGTLTYHSSPHIYASSSGQLYLSWIEYRISGKPRGSMEIFTLSAQSGDIIPEFQYLFPLAGVLIYVLWKKRRT